MASPAFTPPSPPTLSPSSRRLVMKNTRDRSWLHAPALRQLAESSLAAWRAGALPEVPFLPVPSPSSPLSLRSSLSSSQKSLPGSLSSSPSLRDSPSGYDSDDLDSLCRRVEAVLDTARLNSNLRVDISPPSSTAPSSDQAESQLDSDFEAQVWVTQGHAAAIHTPSPVRSEADSDDIDEFILRTVRRRRAAASAFESRSSSDESEEGSDYSGSRRYRPRSPPRQVFKDITGKNSSFRRDSVDDDGDDSGEEDMVDGLCRGIVTKLRFPPDSPPRYKSLDVDAGHNLLPALKGAVNWFGLSTLPFQHLRERAADRLLIFFDKEVLSGRLVRDLAPKQKVTVAWSGRLTKTAGITRMKRLSCGTRTAAIELSEKVVDEPVRLYNTLAHELCHAAAWIIDDCFKPPHGDQFKRWSTIFNDWDHKLVITTCHEYEIRYKFKYKCRDCGQVYGRHSKSIDTNVKVCGKCRGRLQLMKTE